MSYSDIEPVAEEVVYAEPEPIIQEPDEEPVQQQPQEEQAAADPGGGLGGLKPPLRAPNYT